MCTKQAVTSDHFFIKCNLWPQKFFPPCRALGVSGVKIRRERRLFAVLSLWSQSALCVIHSSGDHLDFSPLSLPLSLHTFKSNQFKGTLLMMAFIHSIKAQWKTFALSPNTLPLLLSIPVFPFPLSSCLSLCTFPHSFSLLTTLTSPVSVCCLSKMLKRANHFWNTLFCNQLHLKREYAVEMENARKGLEAEWHEQKVYFYLGFFFLIF